MNCRRVEERLDAYAEGLLPTRERQEVERHLARCAACRDDLAFLRSLAQEIEDLPRSIEPPHDLWPDVAPRVRASRDAIPASGHLRRHPTASVRLRLPATAGALAAAIALVVISSAVTFMLVRQAGPPARLATGSTASSVPRVAVHYQAALEDLTAALNARRAELDPELVRVLEENLLLIEEAIREARAALALDPGNPLLTRMLETTYATKLDLLRRAARVGSET